MTVTPQAAEPPPVHPVYLDVPMLLDFLATIEDGFASVEEVTERVGSTTEREREGKGGLSAPFHFLKVEIGGRLRRSAKKEEETERKGVREHTEGSLFNVLREHLHQEELISRPKTRADVSSLECGDIVEVTGEIVGNPLEQIVDLYARFGPYLGIDPPSVFERFFRSVGFTSQQEPAVYLPEAQVRKAIKKSDPGELKVLNLIRDDLRNAEVRDVLLIGEIEPDESEEPTPEVDVKEVVTGGAFSSLPASLASPIFDAERPLPRPDATMKVVLPLAREFLSERAEEHLIGGRFTAFGKVTRILRDGETINLSRRAAVGILGAEPVQQLLKEYRPSGVDLQGEPVVKAPAIQLLPLAVFI